MANQNQLKENCSVVDYLQTVFSNKLKWSVYISNNITIYSHQNNNIKLILFIKRVSKEEQKESMCNSQQRKEQRRDSLLLDRYSYEFEMIESMTNRIIFCSHLSHSIQDCVISAKTFLSEYITNLNQLL